MNITFSFKTKSYGTDPVYEEEYADYEDYEYDAFVAIDELIEYLTKSVPEEHREEQAKGIRSAEDYIDWDALEDDEDFIEFLKDKYHDKAYAEFLEEKEV